MPITLSIPILQQHNVCSDGQVQFRRKFTRSRTWQTLEEFTKAFADYHTLWNWDEAADKFLDSLGDWEELKERLEADHQEEIDNDHDTQWTHAQLGCVAWCRLYWEKMNGLEGVKPSNVPEAARKYLDAVEKLQKARRFKATLPVNPRVSVDLQSYYKDYATPTLKYISDQVKSTLPAFAENAVAHFEKEAETLRVKLLDVMLKEQEPPAQPGNTVELNPIDSTALCGQNTEKTDDEDEEIERRHYVKRKTRF